MLKRTIGVIGLLTTAVGALDAQHIHYQTRSGYCVDTNEVLSNDECCEPCEEGVTRRRFRDWQEDQFLEEQYEDTGWPSRRDDELSDILMR